MHNAASGQSQSWVTLRATGILSTCLLIRSADAVTTKTDSVSTDLQRSTVNFITGVREYHGQIHANHANLRLQSKTLTEHHKNGQIVKVVATGSPVRFEQLQPYNADIRYATATRAEYSPRSGTLKFWDYTVWDIKDNRTSGKRGLYRFAIGR